MGKFCDVLRSDLKWITLQVPNVGYFIIVGLFCFEWVNCSDMNPVP